MNWKELIDHCVDEHLMVQRAADGLTADDLRRWHRGEHQAWRQHHSHEAGDQ